MFLVILVTLFNIRCLFASPVHDTLSTTINGLHSILKREYIIECANFDAHYGGPTIAGFRVSSMQDLCVNYPQGLGAFCRGQAIEFREPRNPLYSQAWVQGGGGISSLCRRLCHCHDLAPELPVIKDQPAINREAMCSEDEGEVSSSQYDNLTEAPATAQCLEDEDSDPKTRYPRQFVCNAHFYGHPESADCEAAIRKLPDWGDAAYAIRQYSDVSDSTIHSDSSYFAQEIQLNGEHVFSFRDRVRAPVIVSNAACKVAILLPEVAGKPTQRAYVGSQSLINAAEDLRTQCVDQAGSGGKFDRLWFMDGNLLIPNIVMFEKDSRMDDWLTLKTTEPITSSESSGGSQQTACSGSCMDPNDCDINSNCVCATDKPIPLSSTWGQHACMYVAGAALAHIQATTIKPYTRCRGRCLSEDVALGNGYAANVTNHAVAAFNSSVTNQTGASFNVPSAHVPYHHNGANLSVAVNGSFLVNKTSTTLPTTNPGSSTNTNIRVMPLPTGLTCPCNCTYVSASCCLSPIVWEDPSNQVQMDPLAANGTMCCNATSGEWTTKNSPGIDCSAII